MKRRNGFGLLVAYECRKAFWNVWMLVFLAILLAANGWKLQNEYAQMLSRWSEYQSVYDAFYSRYVGEITSDKVADLMAIYGPLEVKAESFSLSSAYSPDAYTYSEEEDYNFFRFLFFNEMQYDYLYGNESSRIVAKTRELAELYANVNNRFEVHKNQRIAKDFSGRSIPDFADTRGYEVLLNYDYSAMLVLMLTVFGLCGVFVTERETEMYMILRSTKKGSGTTVAAKLTASMLWIVCLCAIFFLQDYLTIYLAGGRNEALSSPVYALRFFETTPLNMTVRHYFLWAGWIKTLGILACGCVILLLSSFCQSVLMTFFTSLGILLAAVFMQEISCSRYALKWFNPLELVLIRNLVTEDAFVNVFGYAVRLYAFVIVGIMLFMALLICGILYVNRSYHQRSGRRPRRKSIILITLTLLMLLLNGCTGDRRPVLYNSNNASWVDDENSLVFSYGINNAVMIEKQTEQIHPFPLSAFVGETTSTGGCFYKEGDHFYCIITRELYPTGGSDAVQRLDAVVKVNLDTFEQSVIYPWESDRNWFFGLLDSPKIEDHPFFFQKFFLHGAHFYYLRNSELYRMNRFTGAYEPYMSLPNVANVAYDGRNIYYTDHYNRLVIRSLDSGPERMIEQVVADDFVLTPEGIYYLNLRDNNTLYHWNPVSGQINKRSEMAANEIYWDSDYLWIAVGGATIYRMDHSGENAALVPYEGYVCCIPEGDRLYLQNVTTGDICEINKHSLRGSFLEMP